MRKYLFLFVLIAVAVAVVAGCGKKSEPLEEMQQPMSPEDLSRLKTSDVNATAVPAVTMPTTAGQAVEDVSLEPLPPAGPYKPTAKEIQTALKNAGYYAGTVDGKIGPKSKQAIEDFQRANGLTADGKVGPKTWAALSVYLNAAVAAPVNQ